MRLAGAAAVLSVGRARASPTAEPAKQAAPQGGADAKTANSRRSEPPAPRTQTKATSAAKGRPRKAARRTADRRPPTTAIPLAERIAIQNDLVWTGDYNGLVNGEFGERAIAAVKAFQKRNGGKETGVLNQPERAALAAAAKPKQDAVGWRIVEDRSDRRAPRHSGQADAATRRSSGGTRWASARGEYSGRDLPHRAARHDARRRLRADEEGAGRPQDRIQRAARRTSSSSPACRT